MFKRIFFLSLLISFALGLNSCLTCEKKEYIFQLNDDHSGKLVIRYINIFSNAIDSSAELDRDYDELINMWLKGEKIERDFPNASKIKKRLFEENGKLCGEVSMEFQELSTVRLYRHHGSGPIMFSMSAVTDDGENFYQCNGEFASDIMPVIFWPEDSRNLRFSSYIAKPDSGCVSLLEMWKKRED